MQARILNGRLGAMLGFALVIALGAWVCIGAVLSGLGVGVLPYPIAVLKMRHPIVLPVHMVFGGLGLLTAGAAILLRHAPRWHRPAGRTALSLLVIASLTSVPIALASLAPTAARAGLAAQGIACLICLGGGVAAIRGGQVARHRLLMASAVAIAFGAVTLRLLLIGGDVVGMDPGTTYAVSAWAAWVMPLATVHAWKIMGSGWRRETI